MKIIGVTGFDVKKGVSGVKETMFIVGASEFLMGVNMEESHVVCSQTPSHFIFDIKRVFDWPWTMSNILRGLMGGITFRKQVDSSGGVRKHADSSGGAMFSCLLEP